MPRTLSLIGSVLLIASTGFTEVLITAQDYAVDSDVVLESAVQEIKSIPEDTSAVVGDTVKFAKDETKTTVDGVKSVLSGATPHEKAQKAGLLAVEDAWDSSNNIHFRSYKVSDRVGDLLQANAADKSVATIDVTDFFKSVRFPQRTSARYLPEFKCLFVHHTMDNLLAIQDVLASYQREQQNLMGHQVEIEAKFVEVNQETLNELGFSWHFGSKNGGDLQILNDLYLPAGQDILAAGLRTASSAIGASASPGALLVSKTAGSLQWDLLITALEQTDDTDVLSAPRVVTRDGSTAIIQVGEEMMIPKAFDVNNQDVSPWIEHVNWDLELLGVQLEVTPELREGGLIDLHIIPKVKELIGYDTYQANPSYEGETYAWPLTNKILIDAPELTGSLPYFRIREIETNVTVADGSTVGMGGLIYEKLETFRDKVPVLGSIPYLGRLFRSEGEKSIKRNLMIFVTATQVDVDGRKSSDIALKK